MKHAITLRRIGYLQVAPACGDCTHSADHIPDLVCGKFGIDVQDSGRCLSWQPSPHWLRANREVASLYQRQPQPDVGQPDEPRLSPAEQSYLHRDHQLGS